MCIFVPIPLSFMAPMMMEVTFGSCAIAADLNHLNLFPDGKQNARISP